jgi:hypothetical protein
VVIVPILLYFSLDVVGLNPLKVLTQTQTLAGAYGAEYASSPFKALAQFPLGTGTGMSTSAARYGGTDSASFLTKLTYSVESYYTKAIIETGAFGVIALLAVFGAMIAETLRARAVVRNRALKSAASAYAAFVIVIVINCAKGWIIDVDPVNVYFWLFAGFGIKAAYLDRAPARQAAPRRAAAGYPMARPPLAQRPR